MFAFLYIIIIRFLVLQDWRFLEVFRRSFDINYQAIIQRLPNATLQTRINMQYPWARCIKISEAQILPPSRGSFYALTGEVKFQGMERGLFPFFSCIFMQWSVSRIHLFHFSLFKKKHTHQYPPEPVNRFYYSKTSF